MAAEVAVTRLPAAGRQGWRGALGARRGWRDPLPGFQRAHGPVDTLTLYLQLLHAAQLRN